MHVRASLVLAALLLMLTACGPTSEVSPTAETTPSVPASTEASAPEATASVGTATPTATASTVLGPDTIAEVLVTDLVVRSAPGVEADSEILDGRLSLDQRLYLIEGPISASGYSW